MAVTTRQYVGRLAPSPTGLLHLGHARTFWIAAERARAADGKLWLRNEDLDPQRSRQDFADAMRDDLRWLGIAWDAEMRQSERLDVYRKAMERLVRGGFVYPCHCSRRELEQVVQAPHEDDDEPVYSGTCRPRKTVAEAILHPGMNYRFRVPDGEVVSFIDGHAGPQSFTAECGGSDFGDFVIWRKDGLPSYQLACIVDDAAVAITEVVRGRDLLRSTARQILLQRALELPTPLYFHTDLMRDETGARLAKRHDALSLRSLRDAGFTPADIIARLKA
jgi:glutamyl-tRNA synthetase